MIKLFNQSIKVALMTADTATALDLLQENQAAFQDPLSGLRLEAELLYYAIKKANLKVIDYLFSLGNPGVDVPFYNFCGDVPIGLALKEGLNEALPTLLSHIDKNFALQTAVTSKNTSLIDLLLKSFPYKEHFLRYLGLK